MRALAIASSCVALLPFVVNNDNNVPVRRHVCKAPCVVHFGPNMHEDEFCIDYRANGTLYVARVHNHASLNCRR